MKPVTFTVLGDPVPQPRARVSTVGGFARAYVPAKHRGHAYRQSILREAIASGLSPTIEPLDVVCDFIFVRPKSHSTKRGIKPTAPVLPLPDVDNMGKAVLDALKPLFNDRNVRRLVVEKSYGEEARTTVRVQT